MKKFLLTLLAISGLSCVSVSAQTFESGGLTYKVLSAADKTVQVGKPSKAYAIAEVTIPATVEYEGVTYKVTEIEKQAFMSNSTLTSLTIADGVETIGVQAFQSCSKLEKVDMGNTVVTIADQAFFSVSKLTSLKLSKTVKTVGKWGFRAMSALVSLELSEDLEMLADGACWGDTKLKGITIPDKVKYIGENAFASCSALDSVQLGEQLDSLAPKAFAYCSQVKKLISRPSVPPVCGDDKSIPNNFTKVVLYVKEKSLEVYQKTAPWSGYASILPYDPSGTPDDKTFVMAGVGYEVISLDDLTVGVAHIDTLVYKGNVVVRSTVNYAGQEYKVIAVQPEAFKNSVDLEQVEMPASIANIGNDAFSGCTGLKYIVSRAVTPPALGTNVFTGVNTADCKLIAALDGVEAYKTAAQWKDFTKRSVVFDETTVDGLTYKLNNVIDGTLDFTGAKGFKGELVMPDEVTIGGYPFYITNIAGNSFYNTTVTALTLPKTLKTIAGNAFFTLGQYDAPIERIVVPEGVTSIGSNAFYGSHVNYVDLPKKSLTNLAGSAFYACDIKGIEIPGSVGVINASTFYGSHMNWVILGEGITEIKENAFWATHIGAVRFPSTLKTIGKGAFAGCSYLSSVTINDGLETVADDAFGLGPVLYKIFSFAKKMPEGLVTALTDSGEKLGKARTTYSVSNIMTSGTAFGTVQVRPDLDTWFDYNGVRYLPTGSGSTNVMAVDGAYGRDDTSVEVPESFSTAGKTYKVTSIAPYLLCGQGVMKDVNVTYPMTQVPAGFIYYAANVKSIRIPSTVKSLGEYCFSMTDSLTKVDLPEGLETIGLASFYYAGIKELDVPSTVTLMDNGSVFGCRKLEKLTFTDGDKSVLIGYMPTMFGNRPMFSSSIINELKIGRNLEYMPGAQYGYSPFYGDSIVQNVVITDMPTAIGDNLFKDCKSIRNITIGDKVSSIGASAFSGCAALDSIAIGLGAKSIGVNAFDGCAALKKLYCAAPVPPVCGSSALRDIDKEACALYVPEYKVEEYKAAAQWKTFFNINGYPFAGLENIFSEGLPERFVVFNLNGVLVLDTADENAVNELPAGIYIINGKKVIKK